MPVPKCARVWLQGAGQGRAGHLSEHSRCVCTSWVSLPAGVSVAVRPGGVGGAGGYIFPPACLPCPRKQDGARAADTVGSNRKTTIHNRRGTNALRFTRAARSS